MSGRVRINNPITHNRKVEENMITRHDIAFMVQEIISECHSRPKGAEMIDLIDKYADKFGKDNNEFGHSGDKTVSSYPEDNQQPPKERKVSLEEIEKVVAKTLKVSCTCLDGRGIVCVGCFYRKDIGKAILSLINATEERKGDKCS